MPLSSLSWLTHSFGGVSGGRESVLERGLVRLGWYDIERRQVPVLELGGVTCMIAAQVRIVA